MTVGLTVPFGIMNYTSITGTDEGRDSISPQHKGIINGNHYDVRFWYSLYGSGLVFVIGATVVFWVSSFYRPILFSYNFGLMIRDNPKYTTIACTVIGTLISAFTIYLLNRLLKLMSKQIIASRGATLSTIEVWSRMFNRDFVVDSQRVSISLLTVAFWAAAFYLGTAYTTLITPTQILTGDLLTGTEVDFASEDFWNWYNYVDEDGNYNRTIMGCGWTSYNNSRGSVTYQTCGYDDTIRFLTAGQSAAEYELGTAKPAVSYLDKRYEGVTGGTLPQGSGGWPAFTDIEYERWHQGTTFPSYNYTLHQQGLTANVSCEVTPDGAISSEYLGFVNTTIPGLSDGSMNIINFTWTCPGSKQIQASQWVVPRTAWANLEVCESVTTAKEYTIYISTFGDYANTSAAMKGVFFPNLTCSLTPMLTDTVVKYSTMDALFRVEKVTPIPNSTYRVPNETYQAIDRAFSLANTDWNNVVIDSLHGIVAINSSLDYPKAMEKTLKGYIEFYSTNLRMYYAANEPPGRRPVTGNYTVWRVGYKGQPIVLASVLPPLCMVCALAITYIVLGLRTGVGYVSDFNPVDGLPMMVASAAGGRAGLMPVQKSFSERARDAKILRTSVIYNFSSGQLEAVTDMSAEEEVELVRVRSKLPSEQEDYPSTDDIPPVSRRVHSPQGSFRGLRRPVFTERIV